MAALLERIKAVPGRAADLVLQRQAESRAKAYAPAQHERVRALHRAALVRMTAARGLRDAAEIVAAGTLYREAALLAARAAIAARDPDAGEDLDPGATFARLDELFAERATEPGYEHVKRIGTDLDLLAIDKLSAVEAREHLDLVDRGLRHLLGELEPRSVRRIKVSRVLRLAMLVLAACGAIAGLVFWLIAPVNIARGKPATAISYWPGSAPADALVNGKKESPWASGTAKTSDAWFQIDLLDSYELAKVVVFNRDDGYSFTTAPFAIETSEDGTTFVEVGRINAPATAGQRWVHKGGGRARYVRIRRVGGNGFALSEIEIYGKKL